MCLFCPRFLPCSVLCLKVGYTLFMLGKHALDSIARICLPIAELFILSRRLFPLSFSCSPLYLYVHILQYIISIYIYMCVCVYVCVCACVSLLCRWVSSVSAWHVTTSTFFFLLSSSSSPLQTFSLKLWPFVAASSLQKGNVSSNTSHFTWLWRVPLEPYCEYYL